jgi:hypothetical protein
MKRSIALIMSMMISYMSFAVDSGGNSVYIDQTNADNSTVTITQTGSGNNIGDPDDAVTPAFVMDGNNLDITMTQNGMNNDIVGNLIGGDTTAVISQDGNTNYLNTIQGSFGTLSGNLHLTFTGDSNQTKLTFASTNNTSNYDYNMTVTGDNNDITSTMNSKYIDNDIHITGDTNIITTTQIGYNGTASVRGHKIDFDLIGSDNTFNILQDGVTTHDTIVLNFTGDNSTVNITQH